MRNDLIRMSFSFLAATVTLGMSGEWFTWAAEDHQWWKVVPGAILAAFAAFEGHQVWTRAEKVLGI